MSKPKFTPGPWTAESESLNSITIRATSKSAHKLGQEIASVINEEGSKLTPVMRANARLIIAAPALCEAPRDFVDYYDQAGIGGCLQENDDDDVGQFDGDEKFNVRHGRAALALVESEGV